MSNMVLPVKAIYDALRKHDAFKNIETHINHIPETSITLAKLPLIRITEVGSRNTVFASDTPLRLTSNIQVDIWCRDMEKINELYFLVDAVLRKEGAHMSHTETDNDPDFNDVPRIIKRYNYSQKIQF